MVLQKNVRQYQIAKEKWFHCNKDNVGLRADPFFRTCFQVDKKEANGAHCGVSEAEEDHNELTLN